MLVAHDVGVVEMTALDPAAVVAMALAAGALLSHASIVARTLGIPMVTGSARPFWL